jgi:hypothetical protein
MQPGAAESACRLTLAKAMLLSSTGRSRSGAAAGPLTWWGWRWRCWWQGWWWCRCWRAGEVWWWRTGACGQAASSCQAGEVSCRTKRRSIALLPAAVQCVVHLPACIPRSRAGLQAAQHSAHVDLSSRYALAQPELRAAAALHWCNRRHQLHATAVRYSLAGAGTNENMPALAGYGYSGWWGLTIRARPGPVISSRSAWPRVRKPSPT